MRRIAFVVVLLQFWAPAAPAVAHSCSVPATIDPDRSQTVNVGIAAEETPIGAVVVHVPTGFEVSSVDAPSGWSAGEPGRDVEFTGGPILPFGCGYFAIEGIAKERGELLFTASATAADGSIREFRARDQRDPLSAQLVRVGEPGERGSDASRSGALVLVVVGVVAAGAAVLWVSGGPRSLRRHKRRRR